MADVFISYSREDREWVENFAVQLQSEGFSVWWDWDLLVGKRYRETIDQELQTCRVAVVVWSQHSIQSDFVRDEAEEAQQRNILVPVLKEVVRPPAGFRQIQTADLSTWTGGGTHAEFRRVMRGIANMTGKPVAVGATVDHGQPATGNAEHSASSPARPIAVQVVPKVQAIPSSASQILAKLPPATHRVWRYVAFGVVALVGALLIISQLAPSNPKPPPASVVTRNTSGAPASADTGDIGQTGPHNAGGSTGSGHTGNDNTGGANTTGDSGDIGQGGTH
jgi:hypothetical protein